MNFRNLTEDENGFEDFRKKLYDDDDVIRTYFECCTHKQLIASIMHLGTLFDTISIYLSFIEEQIGEAIQITNEQTQNRRMNKLIKDLNKRINSEYDFNKKTEIIEEAILFDGELYLFVNKMKFIKVMELDETV